MELSIIRDGQRFPYSIAQLRKDNPSVSFPRDLTGVDLTPFGVIVEATKYAKPEYVDQITIWCRCTVGFMACVSLGCACSLRDYVLLQQGHARDYWMSAPYVAKSSTYVQHVREYFQLG